MKCNSSNVKLKTGLFASLYSVWYRHVRVYSQTFLANALPPIAEPLLFFTAIGFGLGHYLPSFENMSYKAFIASGIGTATAMFTGVFETSFGTFVRLVFQKVYDAMLGTHLQVREIFTGELLFCATKGFLFSSLVIIVTGILGAPVNILCIFVPFVGALTAYTFGALGLIVCSYVRTINNFNIFHSGVISPMFFFSGIFFPIKENMPKIVYYISNAIPLTHAVKVSRELYKGIISEKLFFHLFILLVFLVIFHLLAMKRMERRVLS